MPRGEAIIYVLRLLDVGASINLDEAMVRLKGWGVMRGPSTLRGPIGAGAGGVVLSRNPIDVDCGEVDVRGQKVQVRVRLFDFGIASARFALVMDRLDPQTLVSLAASIEDDAGFDDAARALWQRLARDLGPAVKQPEAIHFVEDYSVFLLPRPPAPPGECDDLFARLLLGEDARRPLSRQQIDEAICRGIRYYEDDLVLVDYDAALIIDPTLSTELVDIFELASAHLLELRYYDQLLSRSIATLTTEATRSRGKIVRSPFAGLTERALILVLEVGELADDFSHAITLMGDTYSVQVYRLTAERLRIPEATAAVHQKLEALSRSAEALHNHVEARRGVVLEVLVILLIALEIVLAIYKPH